MNNLWTDTGYISLNHVNEQLCGDRVEIIGNNEKSLTMVLADGLGSGVKANILSTLTSKIICTMMANGMPIEECVDLFHIHHHPHYRKHHGRDHSVR